MTKIVLEGGTDVAEMALFSTDKLPENITDNKSVEALEKDKHLIRLPTGADGGYLLHLYVDSPIDSETLKYCVKEDVIQTELEFESGQLAFGGLESTYRNFKPNPNIRADGEIKSGQYKATAYRTEFPEDYIEEEITKYAGEEILNIANYPGKIIVVGFFAFMLFLIAGFFLSNSYYIGSLISVIGTVAWYKYYTKSNNYKEAFDNKMNIERNYPSIVIQFTKTNT